MSILFDACPLIPAALYIELTGQARESITFSPIVNFSFFGECTTQFVLGVYLHHLSKKKTLCMNIEAHVESEEQEEESTFLSLR